MCSNPVSGVEVRGVTLGGVGSGAIDEEVGDGVLKEDVLGVDGGDSKDERPPTVCGVSFIVPRKRGRKVCE